jgi:hypothetical protein
MATMTAPQPVTAPPSSDDDLMHVVCCDPNGAALCGETNTGRWYPAGDYGPRDCVVCKDLDSRPHARCGH